MVGFAAHHGGMDAMINQVETFEELEQLIKPELWALFLEHMTTEAQQQLVLGIAGIAFVAGHTRGIAEGTDILKDAFRHD